MTYGHESQPERPNFKDAVGIKENVVTTVSVRDVSAGLAKALGVALGVVMSGIAGIAMVIIYLLVLWGLIRGIHWMWTHSIG